MGLYMPTERPLQGILDGGVATFMHANLFDPYKNDVESCDADVGIVGFPHDGTSISRTGANRGPRAIRDASAQAQYYNFEYDLDLKDHYTFADFGDVPVVPGNIEESLDNATQLFDRMIAADILPVMLGGDHTVTTAGARALSAHAENPALINVDTHLDIAEDYQGETYNHCTPVARAIDEAGFSAENVAVAGVSAYNFRPDIERANEMGANLYTLDRIVREGAVSVAQDIITETVEGCDALYVTIDIDVLDAAIAPGTGVPTLGGMQSRELLQIVGEIGAHGIDMMDIVEVSPQLDPAGITARMASRVIVDALAANALGEANGVGTGTRGTNLCSR